MVAEAPVGRGAATVVVLSLFDTGKKSILIRKQAIESNKIKAFQKKKNACSLFTC